MIDQVIAIYTIIDDALKAMNHFEDSRRIFSDAEIITTGIVSSMYFSGHLNHAREFLQDSGLMPQMLGESRFNRRWHACANLIESLFDGIGMILKESNESGVYMLDSFPLEACHNIRIMRNRILNDEEFRGYCASKRTYFYGYRVHIVTTDTGIPVEVAFLPGSAHDSRGLNALPLVLPSGSELFMDAAYTDFNAEDDAIEADGIRFSVMRKKKSTRQDIRSESLFKQMMRHPIETVFSSLTALFPKRIHAVTPKGFLLKSMFFVFAFALHKAFI